MQWLTNFLGWLAKPLSWIPPAKRWLVVYWTLHVLVVLLVVAALAWLNHDARLDRVLRTHFLGLQRVWLPLVFLLGYALFWLIRWLYWLLGPDGAAGEFDDVEKAWRDARRQLDDAGLPVTEVPVFLVLGRSSGPMEQLFAASRQPFQVRHAPRNGDAPLHVYANREAIFVTCEGASLLPVQIDRLLADTPPRGPADSAPMGDLFSMSAPAPAESLPGDLYSSQPEAPATEGGTATSVETAPAGVALATVPGRRPAVLLLGEPAPAPGEEPVTRKASLLKDLARVDLASRRLRHVCKLLVRERQPYCPINGMIVLVPLAATASADDASDTAGVIRHDLEVARTALQQDCPRFVVACDAEKLPGFAELVRHFPEGPGNPSWVMGQHFPLLPDVPPAEVPALIERGMVWVGETMLPQVIGRLWRREGEPGVSDRASATMANIQLYQFLYSCWKRLGSLGRLASRATQLENGPGLLGGCYVAGTGADAEREQGFLAGVFRRAIEHQNQVRWTPEAVSDDAAYHRYSIVGYLLLAGFVVAVALILVAWW